MTSLTTNVDYESYPKVPVSMFYPELDLEFEKLPQDSFGHFILKAINRLCRDANILRRKVDICTQDCVQNYLVEPEDCMDVVAVMGICNIWGNMCGKIHRINHEPCRLSCGSTTWFEFPNTIHIQGAKCGNLYRVEVSVTPRYDACEVDSILLSNFHDVVLAGAKSYIYGITGKSWSSVARAQENMAAFKIGISKAAVETMTGGQRGVFKTNRGRII